MASPNPARRVREVFERIGRERMAGLPLLNDALEVEVVGFLAWRGMHLGVLITPWCVNLMALPGPGSDWRPPAEGVWREDRFPGMVLQLLGGHEPGLGAYAFRSLLSPVIGYDDQGAVRAVAREVLRQLLGEGDAAPAAPDRADHGAAPALSRRRLLGGA
ncbi:MAG: [NiFe]-hydrogenase assembly chaperone HybE [Gammaproteobacteria bacterium]|nr:[NiFe]-hydrogenase assembly chaperone HybE [Gammaproteobacteria bacterium]